MAVGVLARTAGAAGDGVRVGSTSPNSAAPRWAATGVIGRPGVGEAGSNPNRVAAAAAAAATSRLEAGVRWTQRRLSPRLARGRIGVSASLPGPLGATPQSVPATSKEGSPDAAAAMGPSLAAGVGKEGTTSPSGSAPP